MSDEGWWLKTSGMNEPNQHRPVWPVEYSRPAPTPRRSRLQDALDMAVAILVLLVIVAGGSWVLAQVDAHNRQVQRYEQQHAGDPCTDGAYVCP